MHKEPRYLFLPVAACQSFPEVREDRDKTNNSLFTKISFKKDEYTCAFSPSNDVLVHGEVDRSLETCHCSSKTIMATICAITRTNFTLCLIRCFFFFIVRTRRGVVSMTGLIIGYLQRQNYKKRESHLMKSEKGKPVHHTKREKRPGY